MLRQYKIALIGMVSFLEGERDSKAK